MRSWILRANRRSLRSGEARIGNIKQNVASALHVSNSKQRPPIATCNDETRDRSTCCAQVRVVVSPLPWELLVARRSNHAAGPPHSLGAQNSLILYPWEYLESGPDQHNDRGLIAGFPMAKTGSRMLLSVWKGTKDRHRRGM